MNSDVDHCEDQAPEAFKEQEARLKAALDRAAGKSPVFVEPAEGDEDDLADELDEASRSTSSPEPETLVPSGPRRLESAITPMKAKHQVTLRHPSLRISFMAFEVTVDEESSSIALVIPLDIDITPKVLEEYQLTVRGTVYDVVFAGAKTPVPALGGLLIAFTARKVEDDQERKS